jgi:hypothetical protein
VTMNLIDERVRMQTSTRCARLNRGRRTDQQ